MKFFCHPYLYVFFVLLSLSCRKAVDETINPGGGNEVISRENQRLATILTTQTTQTWLNGYIINEKNQPVAGATVKCGDNTTTTDNKGFFNFNSILTVNKDYALISVTKAGYISGFRTFTPNRHSIAYHSEEIMLQAAGNPQFVPSTGGTIISDNVKLNFPSHSVIKPGGQSYEGNIKVLIRYIDPSSANFPLLVPGMLSGLNSAGQINALQSLGMASVELQDESGSKLEIAANQTVRMELPAPVNGPSAIPLWHFNETYGIWVQQGIATRQGNSYVAEVNHFSAWNLDLEFNDFELNLKFQTYDSTPVSNLKVEVYRPDNTFVKAFHTDNRGEATLINCTSDKELTLKILFACDTISYTLLPVTKSRDEIITINNPGLINYEFRGTLQECNNQPLANQSFRVFLSSLNAFVTVNGMTDAQGHFNTSTLIPVKCQVDGINVQTTAFFNNQYYFSAITAIVPGINNYNPALCDTIGTGSQLFNDSDVVNLPDPRLQQTIRESINKPTGAIYYSDVKNIGKLVIYDDSVQSIMGLQYFTGVDSLFIFKNNIPDLTPLQNLTAIRSMDLSSNQISDITPLKNLTNLESLTLSGNLISNVTPLQDLAKLKYLDLTNNKISSVSALQNMTELNHLEINWNQLTDITPLQNLTALQFLYLYENQISDISPLHNLINLQYLSLSGNKITDISYLDSLTKLQSLALGTNQISTITSLQKLVNLRSLDLNSNKISDISTLQNLVNLTELFIHRNQISNLIPLQNLTALNYLILSENNLSSINPLLNSLPNLTRFNVLNGNTIPSNEITIFKANHPNCSVN